MLEVLALEGWPKEIWAGRRAETLAGAARVLDLAIGAGCGFATDGRGGRLFDPVEVYLCLGLLATECSEPLWRDRKIIANREVAQFDRVLEDNRSGGARPTRFKVSVRRRFDLGRFQKGETVRLRLPLPLRCEYHQDVAAEPVVPLALAAEPSLADGRMDVRIAVPEDPNVVIGADLSFTALIPTGETGAGALDRAEAERYLRPFEDRIQVTPRIRQLAEALAGERPPVQAVTAFWRHLIENFSFSWLRYEEIPLDSVSDWVLDAGVYDCVHCASLLVALCRARGIPARRITGHCLHQLAPTNHNWVEIWLSGRGWTPLDIYNRERGEAGYAPDDGWPGHFAQRGDYRLVHERLPLLFTGPMSVRFPSVWQMLHTPIEQGVAITYTDVEGGALIYRDEFKVLSRGRQR